MYNKGIRSILSVVSAAVCLFGAGCSKPVSEPIEPIVPPEPILPVDEPYFKTRGVIMTWEDCNQPNVVDWLHYAKYYHLNTFSVCDSPIYIDKWKSFKEGCDTLGVALEWENHMIEQLLPRELFSTHPEYFRVDESGNRNKDYNGCPSSKEGLEELKKYTKIKATQYAPTNHRYYYWMSDGGKKCHCPKCNGYSESEQALIFENAMIEAIREVDPEGVLCHLAYSQTTPAPKKVKPNEGIFLEFAPFWRSWDVPLSDPSGYRYKWTHAQYLDLLKENLEVFGTENAQVLEYWTDITLFSNWDKNNMVKLPWHYEVFLDDIDTYARLGIQHITTYMIWAGPTYYNKFRDLSFVRDYAMGLYTYRLK